MDLEAAQRSKIVGAPRLHHASTELLDRSADSAEVDRLPKERDSSRLVNRSLERRCRRGGNEDASDVRQQVRQTNERLEAVHVRDVKVENRKVQATIARAKLLGDSEGVRTAGGGPDAMTVVGQEIFHTLQTPEIIVDDENIETS